MILITILVVITMLRTFIL